MITHDPEQINNLRQGGKILATVLNLVASRVKPGVSAYDLDKFAETEIRNAGGIPSFKNYRAQVGDPAFPSSLCVSVNDEVVHGIPTKDKILKTGDIVGLDLGVVYKGLYTDTAMTVGVGEIDEESENLIEAATQGLNEAIKTIAPGKTSGDVGAAIDDKVKEYGFNVVRDLVGHGVGSAVHEDPEIPCFGRPGTGTRLVEGMVIAVEPMVNGGTWKIMFDKDNWTIRTQDGKRSAHMEHTLLITKNGCEILTKP